MPCQASRDDTPRLQEASEASEASLAAGAPAVAVTHLRKIYGPVVAVNDLSFEVHEGEILGILGPNGAGKTTTVECITGLREPDAGTIRLFGLDPQADRDRLREIVGVQLQDSAFPAKLRVGEILDMYRTFYRHPADDTGYNVLPGMTIGQLALQGPKEGPPNTIVVGTGDNRIVKAQVTITARGGQTELRIRPGGVTLSLVANTFGIAREIRRVLASSPGLSGR